VDIASRNFIATTDLSVPVGPDVKLLLKPKKVDEAKDKNEPKQIKNELDILE
jgi:hypothetical protein